MIADTLAPTCTLTGVGTTATGQKYILVTVQDAQSGLSTVTFTVLNNTSAQVGTTYGPAVSTAPATIQITDHTTSKVVITATRIDSTKAGQVTLTLTDVARNSTVCDPVLSTLSDAGHGQRGWQVFTDVDQSEHMVRIANAQPGVRRVVLLVNGRRYTLDGLRPNEVRQVDVARALVPGDRNTIIARASGPTDGTADILIWDGSGAAPPVIDVTRPPHRLPVTTSVPDSRDDDTLLDWLTDGSP